MKIQKKLLYMSLKIYMATRIINPKKLLKMKNYIEI